MRNNRGQMIVFNIMILVIVVVVFMALIPVLTEVIQNVRGSDGLNCVSSLNVCGGVGANSSQDCYNSSLDSETTSCLILDIYLPYIIIVVLLMSIAALMAGRSDMFGFGGQQQQQPQF